MKENKYMLKGFKYLINNEKKKFILIHGVITRVFIMAVCTPFLSKILSIAFGFVNVDLNKSLGILMTKAILVIVAGYITGVIEWNYYKSIIDKDLDKKACRKFAILDGIVGWGVVVWIILLEVEAGQLLNSIGLELLRLLIWSFIGAGIGLMIWLTMDVDKIRKSVREGREMDI